MDAKRKSILFGVASVLVAAGAGMLIYTQHQSLAENRATAETLRGEIAAGRTLVATTPDLEREVIVQRETDAVIKEILAEEAEITNFARTINDYAAASDVAMRGVKRQKANTRERAAGAKDFDQVGYEIQFDADAFQLLTLLHAFETHKRFVSVTNIKLSAAKRAQSGRGMMPLHSITLSLETYVYLPKAGVKEARIENYDRKRALLVADIEKRSNELRVPVYEYRGQRGRRDPWIDPRIPVSGSENILSIEEQIRIVEELEQKVDDLLKLWTAVDEADNLIAEMKARAAIEEALIVLAEEVRRVEGEDVLIFGPSLMKFENVVVAGVADVKAKLEQSGGDIGPSERELEQFAEVVKRHITREEYQLALQAFRAMEPRLIRAERDPRKAPLVQELRLLASRAQTVLDFEQIKMSIGGVAVMAGVRPVALINGDTVEAGEYIDLAGELFVHDIRRHEIEFVYQGVTLIRRIDDQTYTQSTPKKR